MNMILSAASRGTVETASLLSLIQQLSLARGLDEIMACVRSEARRLTGADGITFVLRDGDQCYYADEDAISPLWKGQRFPMETCISGWAMLHRVPAVIPDIRSDERIPQDAYRVTFVRSLVMVPVRPDDPVGAIGAYWAEKRQPSAAEVVLLESIANAAAVAMTNVSLFLSLQQAAEQARAQACEAERRARDLAEAKAALERANQQKNRFLAACSHDLRQPFQAMRLFHAVLAGRGGGPDPVVQRLGEAMAQGEELLNALLDVSTIESGLIKAVPAAVAMNDVFGRLRITHGPQAQAKGLRFRIVPTSLQVTSDPLLLTRILGNLVANAVKYTETGGVLLGARRRAGTVVIEVWDTGRGVPVDALDTIFEDFYQIGNDERDKRRGLGLGLGIVTRLAGALGHEVNVRSRLGQGSVFSVTAAAHG